jgi:hypothetical protein
MKHLQNSGMFYQIKGLFKVQLQDNNLPSRVVTLVTLVKIYKYIYYMQLAQLLMHLLENVINSLFP